MLGQKDAIQLYSLYFDHPEPVSSKYVNIRQITQNDGFSVIQAINIFK